MPFGRSPGDDESPDPTTFATFEGGSAGCDEQSEGPESTTGLSVDTLATGVFPATTGAEVFLAVEIQTSSAGRSKQTKKDRREKTTSLEAVESLAWTSFARDSYRTNQST